MITRRLVVRRFSRRADFYSYQLLQREIRVLGLLVWRRTIACEEIPRHVLIEIACLGGTLNWKSKFVEHIR